MKTSYEQCSEILTRIRKITITHAWGEIDDADTSLLEFALAARIFLEVDLLEHHSLKDSHFRRLLYNIKRIEVTEYFKAWKSLKGDVISYFNGLQRCSLTDYRSFKRCVDPTIPKWIVESIHPFFLTDDSVVVKFRKMLQWVSFDERCNFRSLDYKSQMIDDYIAQEEELRSFYYDDLTLSELNEIMVTWLRDFSLWSEPPKPRHGPGAVADRKGRLSALKKTQSMVFDEEFVIATVDAFGPTDETWVFPKYHDDVVDWKTCDLVVVPKNALTGRTISKEPIALQWVQQAVRDVIYNFVDNNPRLATCFGDQTQSRLLCLRGSIDGSYATIDQSAASDWISAYAVHRIFSDTPLHDVLDSCRSTRCRLTEDLTINLHKYAPMGSSLCFPVMDLVMLACCELAVRRTADTYGRRRTPYTVYGDDVVIRWEYVPEFLNISQSIGLKINKNKSYYDVTYDRRGQYREACGIEAFSGADITPMRLSRRMVSPLLVRHYTERIRTKSGKIRFRPLPEYWPGFIELMNSCYLYNYRTLRNFLNILFRSEGSLKTLKRTPQYYLFARVDYSDYCKGKPCPSPYIIVDDGTASNYHCDQCRNKDQQYNYLRVKGVSTQTKNTRNNWETSNEGLFLWQHAMERKLTTSAWHDEWTSPVGDGFWRESRPVITWLEYRFLD